MADQPPLPPLAKSILVLAVLLNLVVFIGLSRSGFVLILMLFANIAACAVIYFAILGRLFRRLPARPEAQSPSRKSSPISE